MFLIFDQFYYFQSLIEAHDDIAAKNYEALPDFMPQFIPPPQVYQTAATDAIRMVGVRKNPEEPLVCYVPLNIFPPKMSNFLT